MVPLFTAAIFVAAFLLFLIQPLAARLVLPHLGGSPAVWTGTMMFFQIVLLAGYAYAHAISRLRPAIQRVIHAVVLASCIPFLPLALAPWWSPGGSVPVVALLVALAACVGVPFFAISSAGPLIQFWFSRTSHTRAHDPYFLYAASNAGSLLGLLAYPLVVEPALGLREQGWAWAAGYAVFVLLAAGCVGFVWHSARTKPAEPSRRSARSAPPPPTSASLSAAGSPLITWTQRLTWIALAAAVSSLSLGATQFITTDIAAVPLLWVLPLAIYLITFIVAFSRFAALGERVGRLLLPIAAVAVTATIMLRIVHPFVLLATLHLLALAVAGLACHGRLSGLRPHAARLTEYYLLVSIGGALGGVFNALVAPTIFSVVLEYPIALAACCGLLAIRPASAARRAASGTPLGRMLSRFAPTKIGLPGASPRAAAAPSTEPRSTPLLRPVLIVTACVLALAGYMLLAEAVIGHYKVRDLLLIRLATVWVPCAIALATFARPLILAGLIVLLAGQATMFPITISEVPHRIEYIERSFFGVHMIVMRPPLETGPDTPPVPPLRMLRHGTTVHGQQWFDQARRFEPLSYYSRPGPVGDAFTRMDPRLSAVAVIGLGAGTVAAYGRASLEFDFFEIDRTVARLASNPSVFTYLSDSASHTRIIIGDGRLRLADQPTGRYDLIILDAFSSDAIPVHLLTLEAMEVYRSHLAPGGALLVHVSNRHFDLLPPLRRAAAALGLAGAHRYHQLEMTDQIITGYQTSSWVLLTPDNELAAALVAHDGWRPLGPTDGRPAWTDDHANVLESLR